MPLTSRCGNLARETSYYKVHGTSNALLGTMAKKKQAGSIPACFFNEVYSFLEEEDVIMLEC